jgi:hypothetical protein
VVAWALLLPHRGSPRLSCCARGSSTPRRSLAVRSRRPAVALPASARRPSPRAGSAPGRPGGSRPPPWPPGRSLAVAPSKWMHPFLFPQGDLGHCPPKLTLVNYCTWMILQNQHQNQLCAIIPDRVYLSSSPSLPVSILARLGYRPSGPFGHRGGVDSSSPRSSTRPSQATWPPVHGMAPRLVQSSGLAPALDLLARPVARNHGHRELIGSRRWPHTPTTRLTRRGGASNSSGGGP